MIGAISFVILVTAAVLVNDIAEEKVAWITGAFFLTFSLMGYLTGNYFPVLKPLKGWILLWNPFLREPNFMLHLKKVNERQYIRACEIFPRISLFSPSPPPLRSTSYPLLHLLVAAAFRLCKSIEYVRAI